MQIPIQKLKHAARPTPAPAPKKMPAAAPNAEAAEAGTAAVPAAEAPVAAKGRPQHKKYKARHVAGASMRDTLSNVSGASLIAVKLKSPQCMDLQAPACITLAEVCSRQWWTLQP